MGGRPPRLARVLLRQLLHPDDRDCALSDLDEEFETRASRTSWWKARGWYWAQVRASVWPAMERRSMVRGLAAPARSSPDRAGLIEDEAAAFGPWRLEESATWPLRLARGVSASRAEMRLAIRRALGRPVATLASVTTLAVAIGAAAATWSLLSAVLLDPLPVRDPDRLVVVATRVTVGPSSTRTFDSHIYPFYPAVRKTNAFEGLAAGGLRSERIELNGELEPRSVFFASHDYFDTLGVRMSLGREFTADEDGPGAPLLVVLSDRLWRSRFDSDPAVVGRAISLARQPATVVGVAPRAFRGLKLTEAPDLYVPLHSAGYFGGGMVNWFAEPDTGFSPTAWVRIVGRLTSGTSIEQASSVIGSLGPNPVVLTDVATASLPEAARPDMVQFVRLLGGAVGLLLVVGALSVGMLLLVRTEARRDEFAMCLAMGASRVRLACGVALEGSLLALGGVALAVPLSHWFYEAVRAFNLPGRISLDQLDRSVDGTVLAAAAVAGFAASLLITAVAGAFSFSTRLADALRARSGSTPRLSRRRTRAALVIIQTAVAVVLVAGAGLFARSLSQALSLNLGYDTERLVTAGIDPGSHGYDAVRAATVFDDVGTGLIQRPSVWRMAYARSDGGMSAGGRLRINGVPRAMPSFAEFRFVDERYFSTVGLRVRHGRDFSGDDQPTSPLVGIVSESLARFVADGGDPLGSRIAEPFNSPGKPPNEVLIVGVVPDVIENVARLEPLVFYRPLSQRALRPGPFVHRTLVIRATHDADQAIGDARAVLSGFDAQLRIENAQSIDDMLLQQMAPQHFGMLVLSGLGALAVLLTILGTAMLAESMAALRRREMGIRAALGATSRQLGSLVLLETLWLVGAGLLVGLGLSWLAAGTIEAFLFRVRPLDATTLLSVTAIILLLALVVSARPALRVARVDLASVLREE